jgi:hypothetical protein
MTPILSRARIGETLSGSLGHAQHIIKFPIEKQPGVSRDLGAAEVQLQTAVKMDPKSPLFWVTRWAGHDYHLYSPIPG